MLHSLRLAIVILCVSFVSTRAEAQAGAISEIGAGTAKFLESPAGRKVAMELASRFGIDSAVAAKVIDGLAESKPESAYLLSGLKLSEQDSVLKYLDSHNARFSSTRSRQISTDFDVGKLKFTWKNTLPKPGETNILCHVGSVQISCSEMSFGGTPISLVGGAAGGAALERCGDDCLHRLMSVFSNSPRPTQTPQN
jgi:hypothetical protein